MRSKEILKRIKKIELRTKKLVEGLLQGAYHSIFKGRGIEFSEVREYVHGDDIRAIDWNVTARMDHPYVKEYIEERDLSVLILFDVSASSEFGKSVEKREAAAELAASLMFAAMRNNDNVGLALFTGKIEKYIPLRKGRRHVLKMIRELIVFEPEEKSSDIAGAAAFASRVLKKRGVVFIISDFMCEDYRKSLSVLKRRHDVIAVNYRDIREEELPDIGFVELEDAETGETFLVDTSDPEFRDRYSKMARAEVRRWQKAMSMLKIDSIKLLSGQAYEIPLRKFFDMRARRNAR